MTYKLGHASKTEFNGIVNGQSGDQTGVEVTIRSYYMHSKGWYLIRPKSAEHANRIAEAISNTEWLINPLNKNTKPNSICRAITTLPFC